MYLAKIKGNIVSTKKNDNLLGYKLLITQPIDLNGEFIGHGEIISLDLLDSGIGDTVIVVQEGDAVQQILGNNKTPVNTMIIAIVDDFDFRE